MNHPDEQSIRAAEEERKKIAVAAEAAALKITVAAEAARIAIINATQNIDDVAEKAAKRALQIVYAEVGMGVLKKLAWLFGLVILGAAAWLGGKGYLSQ